MVQAGPRLASILMTLGVVLALLGTVGTVGYPVVAEQSDVPAITQITNPAAADNPWGQATVEVHIVHETSNSEHLDSLAKSELDHWEANSRRYAGSNVSFELVDERERADMVVVFQENVTCGKPNAIGCSRRPTVDQTGTVNPAMVWVETGDDDSVTRATLRHEIGHVFGLNHNDSDEVPFMYYAIKGDPGDQGRPASDGPDDAEDRGRDRIHVREDAPNAN